MKDKPATKYALLGALISGPRHGYEILQFLETGLGPTWRVSTSQLYVLLKRLERDGLVHSSLEAQDNRPSKRVFSLKPLGRKNFLEWLRSPTGHVRDLRIEFLAKLFFYHSLSMEGGGELVDAQIKILEAVKKRLERRQGMEKDPYKKLVFDFKTSTLEGWLQWLKRAAGQFVKAVSNHD